MNNLKELYGYLENRIVVYEKEEKQAVIYWLFEHFLNATRTDILLNKTLPTTSADWKTIISRLNRHEPVQYIIGNTTFYGRTFRVSPAVLIPRHETEELIQLILEETTPLQSPKILDIGTGSGCIAITLAAEKPQSNTTAYDISAEALEVAKHNASENRVNVLFEQKNILATNPTDEKWDIIVSNPPYITAAEKKEMSENVLNHEPHLALFVSNKTPLLFYEAIAQFALAHLNNNGFLFFEINQKFGQQTAELLREKGFKQVEIKKDLNTNERFIRANV